MKKIYEKPQAIVTTFNTVDATNANIKSVATLTNINKDSATFDFNNVIDFQYSVKHIKKD